MALETGDDPDFLNDPGDLAWVAFGYADGDLDDEAAAAFERLLETQQSAREALANVVLLAGSVTMAVKSERRGRRRIVAALAMAALLLIGFPRLSVYLTPAPAHPTPEAVALTWSGLRDEVDLAETCPYTDAEVGEWVDQLSEPSGDPPRWLLEAAALPPLDDDGRGS